MADSSTVKADVVPIARRSISKTLRFEVFKRDQFVCQYCGSTPPAVVLELDHIQPVSKGGTDRIENLLTACFECNRGKSNGLISEIVLSVEQKRVVLAEKEGQLRAYKRLLNQIKKRMESDIDYIEGALKLHFPDRRFTQKLREEFRTTFLPKLDAQQMREFLFSAGSRFEDPERVMKYFFGMCWNKIKGRYGPRS